MDPDHALPTVGPDLDPKSMTLMAFLEDFLGVKKFIIIKSETGRQKKHGKLPSMQK